MVPYHICILTCSTDSTQESKSTSKLDKKRLRNCTGTNLISKPKMKQESKTASKLDKKRLCEKALEIITAALEMSKVVNRACA